MPSSPRTIVLACAPDHPLATNSTVRLSQLDGERFVEPPAGWAIRTTLDDAFRAAGLTRRIVCEVNEWSTVLDLVRAGVGVSLLPRGLDFGRHPSWPELRLIPLADVRLDRRVDFVYPKGAAASPATRRFVELLEHHRASAVEQNPALDVPLEGSGQG
jgi:DNA-binding transcriptional LysR family regulator